MFDFPMVFNVSKDEDDQSEFVFGFTRRIRSRVCFLSVIRESLSFRTSRILRSVSKELKLLIQAIQSRYSKCLSAYY